MSRKTADDLREKVGMMEQVGALSRNQARIMRALLEGVGNQSQGAVPHGNQPRLLTVTEAARRLSCSKRTALRMMNDGTLSRVYLRPGNAKSLRIPAAEVEALANGKVQKNEVA